MGVVLELVFFGQEAKASICFQLLPDNLQGCEDVASEQNQVNHSKCKHL